MTDTHRVFFTSRRIGLLVALAAAAAPALAQTQNHTPIKSIPVPAQVGIVDKAAIKNQNGVMYITGGIGEASQERTKAIGKGMNLGLTFAKAKSGDYMADVDVSIAGQSGDKVLALKSSDPLLFAQLKPGSYKVTATAEGKTVERMVKVPAKGQHTENIVW